MITEGEAAIPLETTLHAFRNQEKTKQRSTIVKLTKEEVGLKNVDAICEWPLEIIFVLNRNIILCQER